MNKKFLSVILFSALMVGLQVHLFLVRTMMMTSKTYRSKLMKTLRL